MAEVTARKRNGSSTWEYRIELAKIDGKRQQKSKGGFKTKAEALKAGREALKSYESCGQVVTPTEMSVSDMFDMWLAEVSKTDLQQTTVDGYIKKIRLYIKPNIGHYKVKAVTRQILQGLVTDLAYQGYSKNTVSSVRGIITSAFDWAEMSNMIAQTPAYRLKLPKNTTTKQRTEPHVYITDEYMAKIYDRFPLGTTSHLPMKLAEHTGMRLGECYAITWDDIDLEVKTLTINRQVQWYQDKSRSPEDKSSKNGTSESGGGFWYFTTPKYDSFRTIELDDTIIHLLKDEKERQEKAKVYYAERWSRYYSAEPLSNIESLQNRISTEPTANEINFVFRRENGEYITARTMQHTSRIIHKQIGFEDFDFHSFRHTHATKLRENHAPDIYIQHRLGHAKLDTTMKVYANHLTEVDTAEGSRTLRSLYK